MNRLVHGSGACLTVVPGPQGGGVPRPRRAFNEPSALRAVLSPLIPLTRGTFQVCRQRMSIVPLILGGPQGVVPLAAWCKHAARSLLPIGPSPGPDWTRQRPLQARGIILPKITLWPTLSGRPQRYSSAVLVVPSICSGRCRWWSREASGCPNRQWTCPSSISGTCPWSYLASVG